MDPQQLSDDSKAMSNKLALALAEAFKVGCKRGGGLNRSKKGGR
jgi:hypothetical protein